MLDFFTPILGIAGFFAGILLWAQLTRWLVLLYVSGAKEGGDFLGPPRRRLAWAIPFVALFHPAPWLAGATAFLAIRAIRVDAGSGGAWFVGGLSVALSYMAFVTAMLVVRRRRMRRSQAPTPGASLERGHGP